MKTKELAQARLIDKFGIIMEPYFSDTEVEETKGRPKITRRLKKVHEHAKTIDIEDLGKKHHLFALLLYRFFLLLFDAIKRDAIFRRAASLAYVTILSIFPLLAVVSSTASVFYTEEKEQDFMYFIENQFLPSFQENSYDVPTREQLETLQQQREIRENVREFIEEVSSKFRQSAGSAGVFGFVGLLLTAGVLYLSIESAVNNTWKAERKKNWIRSLTTFTTIIVFFPIIIGLSITASTLAVTLLSRDVPQVPLRPAPSVETETVTATEEAQEPALVEENISPAVTRAQRNGANGYRDSKTVQRLRSFTIHFGFLLPVIPVLVNSIFLAIAYILIPRTRVQFRYAFLGAFVAAVLWELARYIFFFYVHSTFLNRTIVEALGISIFFLVWIYFSWVILLTGNEVTYVGQNFNELTMETLSLHHQTVMDGRLLIAVMVILGQRFLKQGGGLTEEQLRKQLGLALPELDKLLQILQRNKVISHMADGSFQLSRDPGQIKIRDLLSNGCNLSITPVAKGSNTEITWIFQELQDRQLSIGEGLTLRQLLCMEKEETPSGSPGMRLETLEEHAKSEG